MCFEKTGNVRGQISVHTFPPNHWSYACYPSNTFCNARRFQNLGIRGHSHVTRLDQLCANETIIKYSLNLALKYAGVIFCFEKRTVFRVCSSTGKDCKP